MCRGIAPVASEGDVWIALAQRRRLSAYHLYYGDETGSPGTVLTFFYWPGHGARGRIGAGQSTAIAFSAPPASLDYWDAGMRLNGVKAARLHRFGEDTLRFADPDGIPVEIVAAEDDARTGWTGGFLFEIATEGSGFTFDESLAELESGLVLPGPSKKARAAIEEARPPIRPPKAFKAPAADEVKTTGRTTAKISGQHVQGLSGGDQLDAPRPRTNRRRI